MRRAMRNSVRSGRRSGLIVLVAGLSLGGCGGIDTSGLGGGLADYVWGDGSSSRSSGTPTAAALTSGDAIAPDMANVDDAEPIAKHYNAGLGHMNKGNYRSAAESFAEVERQHPYSIWATRAVLMQAYAQYMRNSYDDAINAAQRFLALHPGHKDAPYAYYLVALSHYEQISDVKRDQTATKKALESLDEVSRRFPGTPYARDAEAKAVLARDHLAGKEMEIGRYYLDKNAHLAAINRFKTVITDYQTTTHAPEALYRLTETYLALGVQSEAQTAAAVLGHNYPGSQWYKDAYALLRGEGLEPLESQESWISRAVRTVNPFSG
jgi:outer membrane protein assembly factor BamD